MEHIINANTLNEVVQIINSLDSKQEFIIDVDTCIENEKCEVQNE